MNTHLRLLILSLVVGLVFLASAVGVMAQQATPTGEVELTGVLESISSGTITVSGQTINIIAAEIRNRLVLGSTVKVHVSEVGGVLTAREVETVSQDDDDDDGSNNNSNNTSNNNSNNTSNNNSNNTSNNNSNNTSNNNANNNDDEDDDNGGVRPTVTAQQAIEDVLRVYPTTTIRSVELDTRFGDTLVWEVKIGNGTELVIDAQTGAILVIDRPGDDDDDDGVSNNNSNNTSNNNSNNTSNNNSNNDDDDDDGGSNNNSNNNSNDDDDGGGSSSDNDDNDD